jgi:hypothetical protein
LGKWVKSSINIWTSTTWHQIETHMKHRHIGKNTIQGFLAVISCLSQLCKPQNGPIKKVKNKK